MADKQPLVISRTTPLDELPQFLRVSEVGALADVSNGVVYGLIKEGTLTAVPFGRVSEYHDPKC